MLRNQPGRRSARAFLERLGLSNEALTAIESGFTRRTLMDEPFQIDRAELQRHITYKSVELDNGGVLIAEEARFSDVFHENVLNDRRVRYTTEGRIVDQDLRKSK